MNTEQQQNEIAGVASQGGRASWEEPCLSFEQRVRKHWRQMLVHLWGPAGSLAFHVVAIGVLVTFATDMGKEYIPGPVTELIPRAEVEKPEKEEIKPLVQEVKPVVPDIQNDLPNADRAGLSLVASEESGGSGQQDSGEGMGPGDPSLTMDTGLEIASPPVKPLIMKKLYTNRTRKGRDAALGLYAGKAGSASAKATETAVLRALRWLKKNQESDGSWKGDKMNVPPAMTAMALLTYLAHDETPSSPEFGATVRKALDWLVASQESDGQFKGRDGNNYSQPIAAYALCEAYGLTQHPSLKEAAGKAIARVVKGQHANGGFNYNLNQENRDDSSYMAWCCQALKAAKMAGLDSDVPGLETAIKKAIAGFKMNASPDGGFGYTGPGRSGLSGAGALCLQLLGASRAAEVARTIKFLETCTFSFTTPDQQPYGGGSQVYYWYYITQAKFQDSTNTFQAWNRQFSSELCRQQILETNAIEGMEGKLVDVGHWVSPVKGEHTGGTVQDTCLCTLMLEVYYRYLPSFQHVEPVDEVATGKVKSDDIQVKVN